MNRLLLIPILAIAFVLYKTASILLRQHHVRVKTKEIGGNYAPTASQGFLGIRFFLNVLKSDRTNTFPIYVKKVQDDLSHRLGRLTTTYMYRVAGNHVWMTTDPRNIQAVLATQFEDFDIGPIRRGSFLPALGDGIFVQDGKAWEHSRALIRPSFVKDQVADLEIEEQHVRNLITVVSVGVNSDGWTTQCDIQPLFFRLTIDSASEFLFGESVDSQLADAGLNGRSTNEQAFSYSFDMVQAHLSFRLRIGQYYWLHFPRELKDYIKVVDDFISRFVNLALEKGAQKKQSEEKKRYVFLEELATRTQNPAELKAQLLNILLAGRDTTASLLSWTFYALLRHPEVFEKLRSTVIETFGSFENPRIDYNNLRDCRYLRHCLHEVLRLWPIVPFNTRVSNKWTTLPHGGGPDGEAPVVIRPGGTVNYSVYIMQRRKDLWGEDAEEFRPERWESRRPGWSFLPFNGGPRICPGQTLALTNASYVMVRLLQKFDKIEAPVEDLRASVEHKLRLTDAPARPIRMRMHVAGT